MDDREIVTRITQLAEEEHQLERSQEGRALTDGDLQRLQDIEVALDQCWDLLRQRRARRAVGGDPDDVQVRPADTVENYQQ
jgi:hypothetical protein